MHPLHESGLQTPKSIHSFLSFWDHLSAVTSLLLLQTAELVALPGELGAMKETLKFPCPSSVCWLKGILLLCHSKAQALEAAIHAATPPIRHQWHNKNAIPDEWENLLYNWPKVLLAFTTSPCRGNPVFILEDTGGGSAGSPSCPWLCCIPSHHPAAGSRGD